MQQPNIVLDIVKDLRAKISSLNATNAKAGELPEGRDGIYCVAAPSDEPDRYTGVIYQTIDINARYATDEKAWDVMRSIYPLYQKGEHYETENCYIYYSNPLGQIEDLDRDAEGNKLLKLSVQFILRSKTIVS